MNKEIENLKRIRTTAISLGVSEPTIRRWDGENKLNIVVIDGVQFVDTTSIIEEVKNRKPSING